MPLTSLITAVWEGGSPMLQSRSSALCTQHRHEAGCYFQILREHPLLLYVGARAGPHTQLRTTMSATSLREDIQASCLLLFPNLAKVASRYTHPNSGTWSCLWLGRIASFEPLLWSLDASGLAAVTLTSVMERRQFNNINFSWATTRRSSRFSDKASVFLTLLVATLEIIRFQRWVCTWPSELWSNT